MSEDINRQPDTEQEVQTDISIEEILKRLEEITQQLQDSSSPLETAFSQYREGMELIRTCTEKIDLIEKEVQILGGEETLGEL